LRQSYKTDASVLRETITATVKALGEGRIKPEELPIDPKTRKDLIRYAPGYGCWRPAANIPSHLYTIDSLAKFLGETRLSTGKAHDAFNTTFAALELISEGYLNESAIKGISKRRGAAYCEKSPAGFGITSGHNYTVCNVKRKMKKV
jgi:hypothetical protein